MQIPPTRRLVEDHQDDLELLRKIMLTFATRKLGDANVAEDAVQEAFARVWSKSDLCEDRSEEEARAYLFGTLRHVIQETVRQRKREITLDNQLVMSNVTDPLLRVTRQEIEARIAEAVKRLPVRQREVIRGCLVEGQGCEETAELLDVPAEVVRQAKSRGRRNLKRMLADLFV